MKASFFIPSFRSGGAERVVIELANKFSAQGIDADLLVVSSIGPNQADLSPNVRLVNFDKGRAIFCLLPLVKYLHKERPNALLSTVDNINLLTILAACVARVPTRIAVRIANTPSMYRRNSNKVSAHLFSRFLPLLIKMYQKADKIIAVSEGVKEDYCSVTGASGSRVDVIYNPTINDQLYRLSEEPVENQRYNTETRPIVLAAGRLASQKNYPMLIEAFTLVREKRDVVLYILGEGELRCYLEELIHERGLEDSVFLLGFSNNPFPYMKKCKVFVQASDYEGLPNTLIQAMALGCSIVSTDCKHGPKEILENGKWGLLTPTGEPKAFSDSILQQLDSSHEMAKDTHLSKFQTSVITTKYRELLLDPSPRTSTSQAADI